MSKFVYLGMTELEDHFERMGSLAAGALGQALEKEKAAHQETKREFEAYKEKMKKVLDIFNSLNLSPAKKEENGMDKFKENK